MTVKKRRGRPPKFSEPCKRDTAYLPQTDHETLLRIGGNEFSRGVRVALEAYRQQFGNEPQEDLLAEVV